MASAETVSRLIGQIYDAAFDATLWTPLLADVIGATDARAGHLLLTEPPGRRANLVSVNFDEAETEKYNIYYNRFDPVAPLLEKTPVGAIVTCRDTVSPRERETEFYRDWAAPNEVGDGVFLNFERSADGVCALVLARPWLSKPLATPETLHLLELLIPHFKRAMAAQRAVASVTHSGDREPPPIETHHGCVLLSADGGIRYANAAIRKMMLQTDDIALTPEGLRAKAPGDDALLQTQLRLARPGPLNEVRTGGRITITRPERLPVTIHVLPLSSHRVAQLFPGSTLVLIIDGERIARACRQSLQELYGLTAAEAALAVRIQGSKTLQSVADEMGLSLSTVRTHLQRAFEKTGTHRQAELVQFLSEIGDTVAYD